MTEPTGGGGAGTVTVGPGTLTVTVLVTVRVWTIAAGVVLPALPMTMPMSNSTRPPRTAPMILSGRRLLRGELAGCSLAGGSWWSAVLCVLTWGTFPSPHGQPPSAAPGPWGLSGTGRPRSPGPAPRAPGTPKLSGSQGPCRQRRLGTKWESPALAVAVEGSLPLTCAWLHLREHGDDLVRKIRMHSWGSRGRGFESRRPDQNLQVRRGFR